MASFTLNVPGDAPVTVDFAVPAGWKPDPAGPPASWQVAGVPMVMLAAVSPLGDDEAARLARAISMQYGDGAGAERAELSGGRVWMARPDGDNLHARLFVPYANGVVMGVAFVSPGGPLAAIRAAFETIRVA